MDYDQPPAIDGPVAADPGDGGRPQHSRRAHRSRKQPVSSRVVVVILTLGAAIGGAAAGCHPTSTRIVDPLYTALLAALVTLAAGRASRATVLVFAAVAVGLSRGWLLVPGAGSLIVAFASVFQRRARRRIGALVGAVSIQVILRWSAIGFHGLTALIAAMAVLVCVVSAVTHLSSRGRRWARGATIAVALVVVACTVPVVVSALLARTSLTQGVAAAESALTTVSGGSTRSGVQRLNAAAGDFSVAAKRVGAWWTAEGLLVPGVAQQRRAIAGATETGRAVTTAAARVAATIDLGDLSYRGGQINLARIRGLGPPVGRLDASLTTAQAQLAHVRSAWLVEPLQKKLDQLNVKLAHAQASAGLAAMAIRAGPGILGGKGIRHYLVVFMTPAESRGLDGFIGAYGELSVDNGRISLTRAGSVAQLNNVEAGARHITGLADYVDRYGAFHPADHFQDLSYSPDFPTVERVIAQMYPQSGGGQIDGVLALDPYGLAALLQVTGPVRVPGLSTPLTAENAASFLLKGEYDQFGAANGARHDFLQEALSVAFAHLVGGRLPSPEALARRLDPEVHEGRILFWTDKPTEQPLLRALDLAGSFPQPTGGDLLAVTTQNASNNKIDVYLHRSIDDRVRFDPANGDTASAVTITLRNVAPATGLPADVLGSYPGSHLPLGTNRTWISVYSPLQLIGATQDGGTLPMTATAELGVDAFSAYVDIRSGQTITLRLRLSGRLQPGSRYSLTMRNQPMVNPDDVATSVSAPAGWTWPGFTGAPWHAATTQLQTQIAVFRRS